MRRQTLDTPIRPESSMSNMSFATQAGGVSLRENGGDYGAYNMVPQQNGGNNAHAYMNMGQGNTADVGYRVSNGGMPFVGGGNFDQAYNAPVYNFAIQQPVQVSDLHLHQRCAS